MPLVVHSLRNENFVQIDNAASLCFKPRCYAFGRFDNPFFVFVLIGHLSSYSTPTKVGSIQMVLICWPPVPQCCWRKCPLRQCALGLACVPCSAAAARGAR